MIRSQADIEAGLAALASTDPRLRPVIERAGPVPLRRIEPGLAGLARIVTGQQVSRASADAIFGRFRTALDPGSPEAILAADDALWRQVGMSRGKQRTLVAAAAAVQSGALPLGQIDAAAPDTAIAAMVAVPGIGIWTAECFLLFAAGHPDIFPSGDLALQVGVGHAVGHPARPTARHVAEIAREWSPHRSVAARLIWAYYAAVTRRDAVLANEPDPPVGEAAAAAASPPGTE
ncbi:DNA-3-methyladenine glycosylase family protein [Mangrovibrevibacter kandeliae]|uniref:DNA-3-methyladenine glycosylase family protein n=1 Tax=Mangrovibrevibacter kandeliae TaxID=2968473 RepID=UPI002118FB13|nr:DNA-3-methyladenine glycosylase 2 family protein [Aurantimonas sp. CSK15Z-1]